MKIIPYLNFDGNCAEAFRYYQRVLGGTLELMTHADSPIASQVPAEWGQRIMHARLVLGDQVLLASDSMPGHYAPPHSVYVSLHVDTVEEADRIYAALADGGRVTMPIGQTFWSARFGMCADRFGIQWMVNSTQPAPEPAGTAA